MGGFDYGRFSLFFEKHIGIGLRWDRWRYDLELSLALPFITLTIGLGRSLLSPAMGSKGDE